MCGSCNKAKTFTPEKVAEMKAKQGKSIVETVANGIVGITKALTHVDRADKDVIQSRLRTCMNCDDAVGKFLVNTTFCSVCKCNCYFKTQIRSESCPKEKWSAVSSE